MLTDAQYRALKALVIDGATGRLRQRKEAGLV